MKYIYKKELLRRQLLLKHIYYLKNLRLHEAVTMYSSDIYQTLLYDRVN
jgi:hypothetical protein